MNPNYCCSQSVFGRAGGIGLADLLGVLEELGSERASDR
ncbi:hypothetical protein DB30_05578 [Enhygromyxa salina]|uniref:Uncharacterized protein n=1 Tax=Enhygromyxa salina TaxID=215803 RepID=A0A0C2CWN8_9BACT|nr:hypothetical protein DB30_05578 [Enhygromyxa salina]